MALLLAVYIAGLAGAAGAQEIRWSLPLKWEEVDKPGKTGEIILVPSEINRIAASQDIVYALDTADRRLHRSDNGGLTFQDISAPLANAGAGLLWSEIAVAPDRPQYVAVITDNRTRVYISDDSGATWYGPTGTTLDPLEKIQCIAISNGYLSGTTLLHDIAVGTAIWNNAYGNGHIWTSQIGATFSNWTNQNMIIGSQRADVSAIAFSPRYSANQTVLAVASDTNNTYLYIGARDLSAQTTTWNGVSGYPVTLTNEGDPLVAVPPPPPPPVGILSSISLPSDYDGSDPKTRLAFVGYSRNPAGSYNDVYRIDDDVSPQTQRLNVTDSTFVNVSSIAYYGTLISGKLLAGCIDPIGTNTPVKWTLNPLGTPIGTPDSTTWYIANQPPTGPGNAQVAWSKSGSVAFCGTGRYPGGLLDESAFSQSIDNGNTWQQTSLMNTNIHMTDIAPAPDSRSLFMATYSDFGPESVWRSAGEPLGQYWGRLLNMPTATDRLILRLSPNYATDYTLYAVEVDNITTLDNSLLSSNLLQISDNRGNTWRKRFIPRPVIDVVTASRYTLYLATMAGCIRKSTDGGITWEDKVMTDLNDINMLAVSANGHVFAGSRDGWVAYSTNEGASFTKIEQPVTNYLRYLSDVQVVADANYDANSIIYASGRTDQPIGYAKENLTDAGVWRWTIGQSSQWEQIDTLITGLGTGEQISGLKAGPEGTLYALRSDNITAYDAVRMGSGNIADRSQGMNRTLDPLYPIAEEVAWDMIYRTLTGDDIAFDPDPLNFAGNVPWLKLSGDSSENDLWAIDTFDFPNDNTTAIYRFRDTLCKVGPWTTGPSEVGCDPVSGRNQGLGISWEQLSLSDCYDLQVAKDPAFALRIDPAISNSDNISSVTGSIHISTDPVNVTSPALWLNPGSLPEAGDDYYWRVRTIHAVTGEYITSPWSDTLRFLVKPGFPVASPYQGPQLLSPEDGCGCPCNTPVSFSWSPLKETTNYKFEFSQNADMSLPLVSATSKTTAYRYSGQLECNKSYFWRVMEVEPVPGDWSATFSFKVQSAQTAQTPIERNGSAPLWAWIIIAAGIVTTFVLVIVLLRRQEIL